MKDAESFVENAAFILRSAPKARVSKDAKRRPDACRLAVPARRRKNFSVPLLSAAIPLWVARLKLLIRKRIA